MLRKIGNFFASICVTQFNYIVMRIFQLMAEELGTPLASQTKGEEEDGSKKTRKPPRKAFFLRADVEDCSEAARDFNVEVLPSILLIR